MATSTLTRSVARINAGPTVRLIQSPKAPRRVIFSPGSLYRDQSKYMAPQMTRAYNRHSDDSSLSLWSSPLDRFPSQRMSTPLLSDLTHRMFDEMADFAKLRSSLTRSSTFPVDIVEKDDEYVVTAELPGLSEKDVTLSMEGQILTISGAKEQTKEVKSESEDEDDEDTKTAKGRILLYERSSRKMARSFQLPKDVDEDGVTAEMANGILTVTVPLKAKLPAGRTIPITKAKDALPEGAVDVEHSSE